MKPGDPVIDVSLVLFKSDHDLLERTLGSLRGQTFRRLRILINDEGPEEREGYLQVLERSGLDAQPLVRVSRTNVGFAVGHNLVLEDSFRQGASHVLIINPDVVLNPEALVELVDAAERHRRCALLSGVLLLGVRGSVESSQRIDSRGTVWTRTCRHLDEAHGVPLEDVNLSGSDRLTAAVTGALLLVPRRAYERLVHCTGEFFDGDFFAYREDAELGLRASIVGVPSVVVDKPLAYHFRKSVGTSRKDPVVAWLGARNRFLLAMKYRGRLRPGVIGLRNLRDLQVIVACCTVERDLLGALGEAWFLRRRMSHKRRTLLGLAAGSSIMGLEGEPC